VRRGDLVATISATGTVEPEEVINVGAQVAGQILAFGKDPKGKTIDYGSEVEEGTVLARIDDSLYQADVDQANAALDQANAQVARAKADLSQMQAKLDQATRDWNRAQKLGPSDALSQIDYDNYQAAYEVARANEAVGEAGVTQAQTSVAAANATLARAKRNLSYTTIKSPVKGVIIDRRVNIGQTVVASLSAPSLFLLAKDLKRMQVWIAVNEADIGSIRSGQLVTFTTDAYPGREFKGTVGKVRLNATMTQNVVTYTVEVITDNSDGKLLPYLTANAKFEVSRHEDALLVPNAALRWTPQPSQIAPDASPAAHSGAGRKHAGTRPSTDEAIPTRGTVWVPEGDYVKPVQVQIGATDGVDTVIEGSNLTEGMQVVTGEQVAQSGGSGNTNPFTPQMGRARRAANQPQGGTRQQ
jgi:HlyD family secretion protein